MLDHDLHDRARTMGLELGRALAERYPPIRPKERIARGGRGTPERRAEYEELGWGIMPSKHCDDIAEAFTTLIAEAITEWLDVGSEREATLEELGPVIAEHLLGWSEKGSMWGADGFKKAPGG